MSEDRKYVVISWYYDIDGVSHFKAVNPLSKLLTMDEATKLSTKLEEKFDNGEIKNIKRIGEEITTLERYNQMIVDDYDPISDLIPNLSIIPTNITNESTFDELLNKHIKPSVGNGNNSIEELIDLIMKP